MKKENIIIIAAAAIGLYMVAKMTAPATGGGARIPRNYSSYPPAVHFEGNTGPYELRNPAKPGEDGYGYRYFENGIIIGPDGTRYDDPNYVVPGLERYAK